MAVRGPEAVFLRGLFTALNAAGIRYAVMRNHHSLPDSTGGSDLDILIHPTDAGHAQAVALEAIKQLGGVPIGISQSVGFFQVHAFGVNGNPSETVWWGMRLDLFSGAFFRGLPLLDVNVTWPVQYHRGIPALAEGLAGVLGVLKEMLYNNVFSPRYAPAARIAATENWPQIEALLAPMGAPALAQLRTMLLSNLSPEHIDCECSRLRKAFFQHAAAREGWWRLRWMRLKYQQTKLQRYANPSGFVLAVLGVDGAGKSMLINAILPVLNAATHNAVVVQHLRPTVLPPLSHLKGKKHLPAGSVLEPHGAKPSGKLGSLFRLGYLTLDYIIGYWLWTRPKIAKLPAVVIFDRYAYDMALDPRRFRIALPTRVLSLFAALAPRPDFIVCLHGNPEEIANRKNELSVEETRRQIEELQRFANKTHNAVMISTETSIEVTRDRVLRVLSDFLHAKTEKVR